MRRTRLLRAVLPALFAVTALPIAAAAAAAPAGGCAEGEGVTVVVDLTDLGGGLEVGCAPDDPETGRAALLAAGFTATDDSAGMICAIDANPDPCPAEFAGSYWAYWSAPDGDDGWTAHTEGADTTDPAPGSLEGWRYNDGSVPPGVAPADVRAAAGTAAGPGAAEVTDAADAGDPADDSAATEDAAGAGWAGAAAIGLLVVLVVASALVLLRRRRG